MTWIRIRMDPYSFSKLDPDSLKKLDPDPLKVETLLLVRIAHFFKIQPIRQI
jgi:hypothetical protein